MVLLVAVLGLVGLAVLAEWLRRTLRDAAAAGAERDALRVRVATLARYEGIVDAQSHANAVVAAAQSESSRIIQEARAQYEDAARRETALRGSAEHALAAAGEEANRIVRAAREDAHRVASEIVADARAKHDAATRAIADTQARATQILAEANAESQRIIASARTYADAIAGDALAALAKKDELERAVVAVRNTLDGYGDRYLVPANDAVDDLAEGFSFTDAGQRLKNARIQARTMTLSGAAGTCDYVEANRRETAIRFVVDAFNGKVASILADLRSDNYGTLQQKIRDAFALVNVNGQAFRNARITREYLDLRLEELRWAVATNELRSREREEQRALKERIREEERAQKEFERARKEAEKEELAVRKALEKARRDLAAATAEQKAKYEALIRQLGERLQEAEERGARALSMAQQTRSGTVYVISNVGSFGDDIIKIGMTRRLEPLDRVRELGDASVPFGFDVHVLLKTDDAPALETRLHRKFVRTQMNKANPRKEFFRLTLKDIRSEIEAMGISAEWTMAAVAREYRETLAQEMKMATNSAEADRWEEEQARRLAARGRAPIAAFSEEEDGTEAAE